MNTQHTTIVLFGATGDLVSRKVLPALYELEIDSNPPADVLIPFTRRDLTTEEYLEQFVRPSITKGFPELDEAIYKRFTDRFRYVRGEYSDESCFEDLARVLAETNSHVPKHELFYLPVHPTQLEEVVRYMKDAEVVEEPRDDTKGFERILVEKPFGKSKGSAEELFGGLRKIFAEDEIYCLDHYLGKPMLHRVLPFKKENKELHEIIQTETIASVHVRLFESMGVESRGAFYDDVGAFVDVGQSHALEMFALVYSGLVGTTEEECALIRGEAVEKLHILTEEDVAHETARGQYQGYQNIPNVKEGSETETFFYIETHISGKKGNIVKVIFEGGKALGEENKKEVEVFFEKGGEQTHSVIFRLDPKETVCITPYINGKEGEAEEYVIRDRTGIKQYSEEYKTLFTAAVAPSRDPSLFLTPKEVLDLWGFADPIVCGWKDNLVPLSRYSKNTIPQVHLNHNE